MKKSFSFKKKLSFAQKFLGRTKFHIRKSSKGGVRGMRTRGMIYGLIAFFFGIVVCNLQPESNQYFQSQFLEPNIKSAQLVYLFYDAGGHEYHIFDAQGEHGVPQSWEYLFEGVDVVTGNDEPAPEIQIPVSEDLPSVTGHQPSFSSGTASTLPEPSDPELENTGLPLASVFPYAEKGSLVGLSLSVGNGSSLGTGVDADSPGVHLIESFKKCTTPWGYQLAHGESVLAYQQDVNTPDTCKIERRICFDGKFSGSFGQQSCTTNTEYSYFQEQFVSYTTSPKLVSVQPGNTAENVSNGRVKSGIDEILEVPNGSETSWGDAKDALNSPAKEVEQTQRPYPNCLTPRGETVKHGQFVKAYKHKNGFNDAPCEVQLRTCAVGKLEGNYSQLYCRSRDISYIDWLNGIPNWDLGFSAEKMQWIQKVRDSELRYQKEYGNTLQSEVLEQILAILDA